MDCSSIKECSYIKNLIEIIDYYKLIQNEYGNDIYKLETIMAKYIKEKEEKENNNSYMNIINIYHHILTKHLNNTNNNINNDNYQYINDKFSKFLGMCDIYKCNNYNRNGRNREIEKKENIKHDEYGTIILDILDTIHVYMIHGFDTGFRVKNKVFYDDNNKLNISKLNKHINTKRISLISNRGGNRDIVSNNKFITNLS